MRGRSSPRSERVVELERAVLDETHDGERGQTLHAARDREPRVGLVRDLVAAVRSRTPSRRRPRRRGRWTTPEAFSAASASMSLTIVMTGTLPRACGKLPRVVPEAPLEQTEHGLVAGGDGWYVLNARARWYYVTGRGAFCDLEGRAGLLPGRDQRPGSRAGRGDGDVSLGGRPGGLPRRRRRCAPDHRR